MMGALELVGITTKEIGFVMIFYLLMFLLMFLAEM